MQHDSVALEAAFAAAPAALIREAEIGWWPYSFDPTIASVRIRCLHPLAYLKDSGYPVELFDAAKTGSYKAVLFSKHFSQKSLEAAQELKRYGTRIIYDFCDNYFHNPFQEAKRQGKTARLFQFLELADQIVVSTEVLADVVQAEARPSAPVSIIGDAVEKYPIPLTVPLWRSWTGSIKARRWTQKIRAQRSQGRHPVVWFGNRGNAHAGGIRDIAKIRGTLEAVNREVPLVLTVVSNDRRAYREVVEGWSVPTQYVEWDLMSSATIIAEHDVALIPVVANPITTCKTNNRLVFALHLGVPVVADSIPSYRAFSDACVLDDWEAGLRGYLLDGTLRARHLAAGRAIIEKNWTIDTMAAQWAALFDSVLQA